MSNLVGLISSSVVLVAAAAGAPALAQDSEFNGLAGTYDSDTEGNREMNGTAVTSRGRVGGDLEMNGASVDVEGEIGGDADLNGASIEVDARIHGRTIANGAGIDLEGWYGGPVDVNAAGVEFAGVFEGPIRARVGGATLSGTFQEAVDISGEGRGGLFRRGDRSEIVISGDLQAGGTICAHEVVFRSRAALGAPLTVRADNEPELNELIDASLVTFTPREDRDCNGD